MKEAVANTLKNIKEDAEFLVYEHLENGQFRSCFKRKEFVLELLNTSKSVVFHNEREGVLAFGDGRYGITIKSFNDNICFDTKNVEGFEEHISQYNKYYKVFIKLNKKEKTIEFKLGDKYKKLQLIENTDYVSKPFRDKTMKIIDVEHLYEHMHDEFWNPRMITIGRNLLGLEKTAI